MNEWILTNGLGGYSSKEGVLNTRKYHGLLISSKEPPVKRRVLVSELVDKISDELINYSYSWKKRPFFSHNSKNLRINKTINMVGGENTVIINYSVFSKKPVDMIIYPFINNRNIHSLNKSRNIDTSEVFITCSESSMTKKDLWKKTFYEKEKERGYDSEEYVFSPGFFKIRIIGKKNFEIIISDNETIKKRTSSFNLLDSFVVKRGDYKTIIAGYHWFSDWGRDSMISIPGLLLSRKKYSTAKKILTLYSKYLKKGMIPHVFLENNEIRYDSIDTSLWFVKTVHEYSELTGDDSFEEFVHEIINNYKNFCDSDGLVINPGLNSWMDTLKRQGKLVEVNSLWYNCLKNYDYEMAGKVKNSFKKFWNNKKNCLYDSLNPDDESVRPNQLFAVGLEHTPLSKTKCRKILNKIVNKIVTPYGLRSLSPDNPNYKEMYYGSVSERDRAYHNGIIWPWLIGIFLDSCKKIDYDFDKEYFVKSFKNFILIPEIFDSEPPFTPRGCISQAWSVAELYRHGIID